MTTYKVSNGDGSTVTFTPSAGSGLRPGDLITFACDPPVPNPDRRWWQFWKPRKVLKRWVVQ